MRKPSAGFTLIEFMIAAAVAAIMLAVALPSYQSSIMNNRMTAETNRLVADIQLARSEAMKRGAAVIICPSADAAAATPTCAASNWASGWLVFASGDSNATYTAGTDTLIKASEVNAGELLIGANTAGDDDLRFRADASTNEAGNTVTLTLCDNRGASYGKKIEIPPMGRPRLATSVSTCPTAS